ncbi:MAG: hypothetical protein FWF47_02680 [Clostridia bacterium]|nr:hypothetical protein [Clostridia bacterium]
MRKEYTQTNKERIREDIYLHDLKITKLVWDYQDRFVSFEIRQYDSRHETGRLTLYKVVYIEGSALGLWNGGVEYPIYLDCIFAGPECSVSNVIADCVKKSKAAPEICALPNPDDYFCVVLGTTAGDQLRFIVEKIVWETDE